MMDQSRRASAEAPPCSVRRIEPEDVLGAALLHRITFPDYFLTHMGQGFVERFYSEFVDRNGNYGYVAVCGKELVGSVIGTLDSEAFFHHFYRRNFPSLALTFVVRFMVDPYVRRNLRSRMARVRQALRTVAARSQQVIPSAESPAPDRPAARLLSISVHPEKRGSGLAEQLVDRYCEALWRDGWPWVGLSVRPANARAIAFYERTGWQRSGASASAVQYVRSTRTASATGGAP